MEDTLHYLLLANQMMFQKQLFLKVKDTDITLGQPKVLDYLNSHNGAVQKEIANGCHLEPATITSILNGMEKKGLIIRKMQEGNRRSLYVYLTLEGQALANRVGSEFEIIEETAFKDFSIEEKEKMMKYLRKMYKNLLGE